MILGIDSSMISKNSLSLNSKKFTKRRIMNKNPNCNHNNNNIFYQPTYGNIKYDDRIQKKEDVLRNFFFQECDKADKQSQAIMLENSENTILNKINYKICSACKQNLFYKCKRILTVYFHIKKLSHKSDLPKLLVSLKSSSSVVGLFF